jgi:hypothetical protein
MVVGVKDIIGQNKTILNESAMSGLELWLKTSPWRFFHREV